jgi:hypothetical protein
MHGIMQREAYLEFAKLPLDVFKSRCDAIMDYASDKGLMYEIVHNAQKDGLSDGTARIYPLDSAQDVLRITDEISDRIEYPLDFRVRPFMSTAEKN